MLVGFKRSRIFYNVFLKFHAVKMKINSKKMK